MGLFRKEPYETMTDQEFVDEMIRIFDIRLMLEHAISILRDQEKGLLLLIGSRSLNSN